MTPNGKAKQKAESSQKPVDFFEQFRAQLEELDKARRDSERKAAEYFEKLQRLQADMENLQKITKRQMESVTKQASEGLVLKLLPILDALQQAGNFAHSERSMPTEEIGLGLNMLEKQLREVLRTEGLQDVPAVGQPLNPERHEVVSYVENDDVPENTVIEEVRRGYLLNGRLIRSSLVIVSKRKSGGAEESEKNAPG
jgi:molecular chaperone GrpE